MSNNGKQYENLTARVYDILLENESLSNVEQDQKLDGPDGPRQIDVLIRSKVAGLEILTIVECRDYARPLDIGHVDGLHSKMQDVKAQKAVLVSPNGFSAMATKKANRLGFSLATLGATVGETSQLKAAGLDLPILVTKYANINVQFEGLVNTKDIKGSPQAMMKPAVVPGGIVNGINIADAVRDEFLSGELPRSRECTSFNWLPSSINEPYYWGSETDDPILPLRSFEISISFTPQYYFGYVSQLSNSKIYKNLTDGSDALFFRIEDIATELDGMAMYSIYEDIPLPSLTVPITAVAVPEISQGNMSVRGTKRRSAS